MRRNILLDIDGVLANFYAGFGNYLNQRYNANLDLAKEPPVYSFSEWGPGLDAIDMEQASNDWIASDGFLKVPVYPGAKEFVEKLMTLGNVHIVTARVGDFEQKFATDTEIQIKNDTYEWFRIHHIPTNGRIRFAHKKVNLCKEENISILVEDKLSTVLEAAQEGIHSIIMDRAWNHHPDRFKVYRANNYDEILDFVRKLSQ